ncbi:hypothetical protein SAMN04487969_10233 [Paenibacillus algorifonticola]|uniref:Uncharacterized protein n=1 Tax=Paenibacillus algorifonticola TaxID=684063 RepID=A0A1I1ZR43_9BACL|nr:hypothetical protein [Paenibacillus algorifonticola]SFE34096.1 hypothetical protein SAMN04487969_10233 [Paenibacillus algorifonticola]
MKAKLNKWTLILMSGLLITSTVTAAIMVNPAAGWTAEAIMDTEEGSIIF